MFYRKLTRVGSLELRHVMMEHGKWQVHLGKAGKYVEKEMEEKKMAMGGWYKNELKAAPLSQRIDDRQ